MTPYAFTETVLLTTIGMFPLGTNIEPASKKLLFPLASQESITFSAKTKIIGAEAFQGCTNLKEITLPASVSAIRFFAFEGCKKLKKITFKGNAPTIEQYALGNTSLSIFYPSKASGWVKAKQNPCGGKIIWKSY